MTRLFPVLILVPGALLVTLAQAAEEYANSSAYSPTSATSAYVSVASEGDGHVVRQVGALGSEVAAETRGVDEAWIRSWASFAAAFAPWNEAAYTDGCDWNCGGESTGKRVEASAAPALSLANGHGLLDNDMLGLTPAEPLRNGVPDIEWAFASWTLRK